MNIKANVYVIENPTNKIIANASIVLDDSFVVKGLKVFKTDNGGMFVSMPNKKKPNSEEYADIAYPITKELREQIQKVVLDEFKSKSNKQENVTQDDSEALPF